MATVVNITYQLKRGTTQRWTEVNPILRQGEPGFEIDTGQLKIGNGINAWIDLPYVAGPNGTAVNLIPVDGSIVIKDNTIDIGISSEPGNALLRKTDGLYVGTNTSANYKVGPGLTVVDGTLSVKLADNAHGLSAVDGALMMNLATTESDGAMSKEDKKFLDELKDLNISDKYATKNEMHEMKQYLMQIEQSHHWLDI